MDVRHKSAGQLALDKLILSINNYILLNTNTILTHPKLQALLASIVQDIFSLAHVKADARNYLTKENLLSIDVVQLPTTNEHAFFQYRVADEKYAQLFTKIKNVLDVFPNDTRAEIQIILQEYTNQLPSKKRSLD